MRFDREGYIMYKSLRFLDRVFQKCNVSTRSLKSHSEVEAFGAAGILGFFYKHYNARSGTDNTFTLKCPKYHLLPVASGIYVRCQSRRAFHFATRVSKLARTCLHNVAI